VPPNFMTIMVSGSWFQILSSLEPNSRARNREHPHSSAEQQSLYHANTYETLLS
jgi:hypothetical protein